jgi:hypothetical protein
MRGYAIFLEYIVAEERPFAPVFEAQDEHRPTVQLLD